MTHQSLKLMSVKHKYNFRKKGEIIPRLGLSPLDWGIKMDVFGSDSNEKGL